MVTCISMNSQFSSSAKLTSTSSHPFPDPQRCHQLVGGLQYLTMTRLDISYVVNQACQFMHNPLEEHWVHVKRILCCLKGTTSYDLYFHKSTSFDIHAYSDSDWVGAIDDCCSTSGYAVFLGPNLVSWSSRKQRMVACTSTEAEFKALANVASKVSSLQSLLFELGVVPPQ